MLKTISWVVAFILLYVLVSYIYSTTDPVEEAVTDQQRYERCIAAFAGNIERLPECDQYLEK